MAHLFYFTIASLLMLVSGDLNITESQKATLPPETNLNTSKPNLTAVNGTKGDNTTVISSTNITMPEILLQSGRDTPANKTVIGVLQSNCTSDKECAINGSSCIKSVCSCDNHHVLSANKSSCLQVARMIEDMCYEHQQCTLGLNVSVGETICLSRRCVCAFGFKLRDGRCVKPAAPELGTTCSSNEHCGVPQASCIQGICDCLSTHKPHPNNLQCLPVLKNVGDSCIDDNQCENFGESHCTNGTCACKPLNHLANGVCSADIALGSSCSQSSDCIAYSEPGKRDCINGICQCIVGKQVEDVCKGGAGHLAIGITLIAIFLNFIM